MKIQPGTEQQQVVKVLVAQGLLGHRLALLMEKENYAAIAELLNAYKYNLAHEHMMNKDKSGEIADLKQALDIFEGTTAMLPEFEHALFTAIVFKHMDLSTGTYTFNEADYKKEFLKDGSNKGYTQKWKAEYEALSSHPFAARIRDTLRYSSREQALESLSGLWNGQQRQGFFFLYEALQPLQNAQQYKIDPDFTEEKFKDSIATHPGLEFVVLDVPRGTMTGSSIREANLPNLRLVISNKPLPVDYAPPNDDEESEPESPWLKPVENPEFTIITAKGGYTKLSSYLRGALKHEHESRGLGPYAFTSNDDLNYGTAANLMAVAHNFLRVPNNFLASAQERLRGQVKSIETTIIAPIYMQRFLRAQDQPDWATALSLTAQRDRSALDRIDFRQAAKILVLHGFSSALNSMDLMIEYGERNDAEAGYEGFVEGLQALCDDMRELSRGGDDTIEGDALTRYEVHRGFHPDVLLYPVSYRKALAFQDLSNIALSHLNSNIMLHVSLAKHVHEPNPQETLKNKILSAVPLEEIAHIMIKANDIPNVMRILEHHELLKTDFAKTLARRLAAAGYYVTPKMQISSLDDLGCRIVFKQDGEMMIRTDKMTRFMNAGQIVAAERLDDAVAAHQALSGFRVSAEVQQSQASQLQMLKEFISSKVMVAQISSELKKHAAMRDPQYRALVRSVLPSMLMMDEGGDRPYTDEEVDAIVRAFDEATGQVKRPALDHVNRVYSAVSHLFQGNKPPQPSADPSSTPENDQ